ncbi:hypothetical protein M378DRAFT_165551 [Amanita muscaria Koide BX008]|uniref:Uncharacterized protein n=1 Tax=Amanita muscaria (strain Koide BX008) TaxID=946122 RepID=A0A0C2SHD3_AMAMK|nr:hypothetical protein M378DRAFT_165551 [Amanita muscaria Koide BX008]
MFGNSGSNSTEHNSVEKLNSQLLLTVSVYAYPKGRALVAEGACSCFTDVACCRTLLTEVFRGS